MEPLFENETTIDAGVLEEWQKKELATNYRMVYAMFIALMALCLVFSASSVVIALSMGTALPWVLAGLFLVLFGLLLWAVLTMPKRMVRTALKREGGEKFPYRSTALFYEEGLQVQRNRPPQADDPAVMQTYLDAAALIQAELQDVMESAEGVTEADEEAMAEVRLRAGALRVQMEALSASMPKAEGEYRCDYDKLTGYTRTLNLQGLYFQDAMVLISKNGFRVGDNTGFEAFVRRKLEQALAAAPDEKAKKPLATALARYWPAE